MLNLCLRNKEGTSFLYIEGSEELNFRNMSGKDNFLGNMVRKRGEAKFLSLKEIKSAGKEEGALKKYLVEQMIV